MCNSKPSSQTGVMANWGESFLEIENLYHRNTTFCVCCAHGSLLSRLVRGMTSEFFSTLRRVAKSEKRSFIYLSTVLAGHAMLFEPKTLRSRGKEVD